MKNTGTKKMIELLKEFCGLTTFINLYKYTNEAGEIASHMLNFGMQYVNAKKQDLESLKNLNVNDIGWAVERWGFEEVEKQRLALVAAFEKDLNPDKEKRSNRSKGQSESYYPIAPGISYNINTGELYFYTYRVRKKIFVEGTYEEKEDTRKESTKIKDAIRHHIKLESKKFKRFRMDRMNEIRMLGNVIVIK